MAYIAIYAIKVPVSEHGIMSFNTKMINQSYKNKNNEYERKGDRQLSENATAKNVNKINN